MRPRYPTEPRPGDNTGDQLEHGRRPEPLKADQTD